ncbi:hypothetical protein VaNZ11_002579 [Volvox africanus]|uniref:Peptidase S8/S53 domain-containing protein n=1 Tax=Volvox africanus TaxID=51714 RepID=A0ABQ5RTJ6_9CHLO|nr:hypothetical protein VaNZ11_002579 [Volvox africanus]
MALSNLQILEAVDEVILNTVLAEIKKRTDIEFVVRDFILWSPSTGLDGAVGGTSGRRLLQSSGSSSLDLNDPGLQTAYWFNKINVTGAWRLLGINTSDPQRQLSDVVIAVTDSGALVNHGDLIGSFWNNPDEIDDDLADNDNNTFIDDFYGAAFAAPLCSSLTNISRCGIGRNTSFWNGITDRVLHGTKIAGIIGAHPNNNFGLAGMAPNLRQMILKVTDESLGIVDPSYTFSDVIRAVDYAYGKGARIFSMSFGPNAKSLSDSNKDSWDKASAAYKSLFTKYNRAVFVAAAGNEWTNLDIIRARNFSYPPCTVGTPNVICVGGTTNNDTIFYAFVKNQDVGTNFGPNTVDMSAPGMSIYTTDSPYNGNFTVVSGTSYSTPMVAAAAGLVLAALGGQTRATPQTPALIKNLLVTSGDSLQSLQGFFRSGRRLNVGNAVAAALVLASTNRTVVQLARRFDGQLTANVTTNLAFQGWEYTWWKGTYTDGRFDSSDMNYTFEDFHIRSQPSSNFNILRYTTGYRLMATAMARIDSPGFYSIQYRASNLSQSRWQLTVGENPLVWTQSDNNSGTVDLIFPEAGFYNMTLWMYPDSPTSTLNFLWQMPGSPSSWTNPPLCWVINDVGSTSRYYDPNLTPKPALWHVVWNESDSGAIFNAENKGFFAQNKDPWLYRTMQTTVPDFSFATGMDLRNALYGTGGAPSNGQTVVYGYARANLRPRSYSTGMSFRLQGAHMRLYINDQMIFDFQNSSFIMIVTPCVTLQNNVSHELYLYFAARTDSYNPVGLTWASCNSTTVPTGTSGAYSSMSGSLATNYFWTPSSITNLPRGFRCDAWAGSYSATSLGTTPPYGTPSNLTWMYPRDCPAAYRNTTTNECRMQTKLKDLFPSISWPLWHIRCFTYYAGSITNGITGASVLSGVIYQHLAGVRVYYQPGDNVNQTNYAPYNTRFPSGTYQLYVIEWVAQSPQWNTAAAQTILDGGLDPNNNILTTNSTTMILPAATLASFTSAAI